MTVSSAIRRAGEIDVPAPHHMDLGIRRLGGRQTEVGNRQHLLGRRKGAI
jgi:hypothetical protein